MHRSVIQFALEYPWVLFNLLNLFVWLCWLGKKWYLNTLMFKYSCLQNKQAEQSIFHSCYYICKSPYFESRNMIFTSAPWSIHGGRSQRQEQMLASGNSFCFYRKHSNNIFYYLQCFRSLVQSRPLHFSCDGSDKNCSIKLKFKMPLSARSTWRWLPLWKLLL